ncbi:recombinase family protein [Pseudarthrobacter sulfonivorans]|uniref:recombinase family protein n=1 Tax=Pseudarthrobacter sulfonivorans TaxID=121292 RepID=UPI00286B2521|nr:recombinase family protein [Pseudarthrobacter sulfonivorans]
MEHASGAPRHGRDGRTVWSTYNRAKSWVVTDLTRLGRSTADLSDIVTVLGRRGIGFRSLAELWLDTTSARGKLTFDMFAFLAEYERSRLSERTNAGGAAAKARGRLGGRPPAMTAAKLEAARDLRHQGKKLQEIAEILSVSMSTVTRALGPRTSRPGPGSEAIVSQRRLRQSCTRQ